MKASNGNSFIISRNEKKVSESDSHYWIYIVYRKDNGNVSVKQIPNPEFDDPEKFQLEPKSYYVSFDGFEEV